MLREFHHINPQLGSQVKQLVICFLLTLLSFQFKAQNGEPAIFSLKPALGINASQVHGDAYTGFKKAGIFGGTAVNARINKRVSLELGFYFSQKGSQHNQNPEKGDYTYHYLNLNYIDFPLSVNYYLNKDYFVSAGPSIAYLVSYREANEFGNWTGMWPFEATEVGLNVGLGKKIKKFSVEIRSSNSILPVRPYGIQSNGMIYFPNAVARFFNKGLYNNVITFFVSYKLDFKKKQSEQE